MSEHQIWTQHGIMVSPHMADAQCQTHHSGHAECAGPAASKWYHRDGHVPVLSCTPPTKDAEHWQHCEQTGIYDDAKHDHLEVKPAPAHMSLHARILLYLGSMRQSGQAPPRKLGLSKSFEQLVRAHCDQHNTQRLKNYKLVPEQVVSQVLLEQGKVLHAYEWHKKEDSLPQRLFAAALRAGMTRPRVIMAAGLGAFHKTLENSTMHNSPSPFAHGDGVHGGIATVLRLADTDIFEISAGSVLSLDPQCRLIDKLVLASLGVLVVSWDDVEHDRYLLGLEFHHSDGGIQRNFIWRPIKAPTYIAVDNLAECAWAYFDVFCRASADHSFSPYLPKLFEIMAAQPGQAWQMGEAFDKFWRAHLVERPRTDLDTQGRLDLILLLRPYCGYTWLKDATPLQHVPLSSKGRWKIVQLPDNLAQAIWPDEGISLLYQLKQAGQLGLVSDVPGIQTKLRQVFPSD